MKEKVKYAFWIFLPFVIGSIVGFLISGSMDYQDLVQPPFAPPSIVFPIAWTILYLLIGIAYFRFPPDIAKPEQDTVYHSFFSVDNGCL